MSERPDTYEQHVLSDIGRARRFAQAAAPCSATRAGLHHHSRTHHREQVMTLPRAGTTLDRDALGVF